MPHPAFWSGWILFAGTMCVLMIFALAVRWDEAQADLGGTVSGS